MKVKKIFWIILGCVSLGLGALGVALPILPSVPFLLLAAFSFAKSSKRLHDWFTGTKLYQKHLEGYVKGQGMTRSTKLRILSMVTGVMAIGFVLMLCKGLYIPCLILGSVWLFHLIYFLFIVRTRRNEDRP